MTWIATISAFLGTIVAFILIFLLFSDRHWIRNALRKGPQRRLERRTSARVGLELSSLDEPSVREITFTRNVSRHGACALTKNRWAPNNSIQVRFLNEGVRERARIAYCNKFGDVFAVGLQFSTAIDLWVPRRGLAS